jgi:Do/DeqQ family serine protease
MKKTAIHLVNLIIYATITWLLYSCETGVPNDSQTKTPTESFPQAKPVSISADDGNFIIAARVITPCVVHIKTSYENSSRQGNFFQGYEQRGPAMMGSGSGVVISADGYIATNNHVVENADQVEVVFPDRRSFFAKLVGRDPNTDLALLKVDVKDLPFVALGNSDSAQVGEWVLAVGYPYSLNTTVTAGIISAKGRSIGIINRSGSGLQGAQTPGAIESFIQTDAAINPGNSGGALVNMSGQLIGINTAIASLTGSYAGYAFAIPVNLVKKIMEDLKEFGSVKRGLLGVSFPSPSAEDQFFKQQGINPGSVKGVFIIGIQKSGAADEAGLEEGDIIQRIDDIEVSSSAEFSERIARHRPGDKIKLEYLRNGKSQSTTATLKNEDTQKNAANSQSLQNIFEKLGATFSPLSPALKEHYNLDAGVLVAEVRSGGFFDQIGIPPGTIIVYINGKQINSPQDINRALIAAQNSRIQILGIAPDGSRIAFNFSLGT